MTERPPETWLSDLRWRIAIRLHVLGLHIAPAGTARDRWLEYNKTWAGEVKEAWKARYQEQTQ